MVFFEPDQGLVFAEHGRGNPVLKNFLDLDQSNIDLPVGQ
jgi:hypothetical protein